MYIYIYIYIYCILVRAIFFYRPLSRSLSTSLSLAYNVSSNWHLWDLTHAACASGTWVHPLRPLGQSVYVSLSLGIAFSSISFSSTHTRPRLNNNNKHKRYTMARLYPQIFFRNEELCQWLVGHVPGIEGSGHCGSTLLWAFVSLGATQPTIHAFFTHTRPHRTTTNTRDTLCPSSTLGKIFE